MKVDNNQYSEFVYYRRSHTIIVELQTGKGRETIKNLKVTNLRHDSTRPVLAYHSFKPPHIHLTEILSTQ